MTETTRKKKAAAPKKSARAPRPTATKRQAAAPKAERRAPERKPAAARSGRSFVVVQVRSGIGCTQRQRGVLRSLGLRGPRDRRTLPDVPSVRGMVASVPHLVRIEEAAEKGGALA